MATQDNCRLDGCMMPAKYRGVCGRHYGLAMKGSPGNPEAELARAAILPPQPKRGRKWKMPAGGTGAAAAREEVRGDTPSAVCADAIYAAICAFATATGIRYVDHAMGRLFLVPGVDGQGILLTAEADMRDVTFKIGGGLVIRDDVRTGKDGS